MTGPLTRRIRLSAWMVLAGLLVACGGPAEARAARETVRGRDNLPIHQKKHRELQQQFAASLLKIAETCDADGFPEDAARIRALATPSDPQTRRFDPLPKTIQPEIRSDLPAEERKWRVELRHAQQDYAKDLYLLAQRLVNHGYASYAFDVIREAASQDPDNKAVRRVLGFVRHEDRWVTPFTSSMLKKRYVWHDTYGWLPSSHVARYENGERYFRDRFVTAQQEAVLRRSFDNAWEVRTDNFRVKTNHSLERGVEVAVALEEFHEYFVQAFAAFFQSPEQLKRLFRGDAVSPALADNAHDIHYYSTREEYVERLKVKIPQIEITNGLYLTGDRTAYFFHNASEPNDSTLYHEATHQLLYESAPSVKDRPIAQLEQFWIIEGIACYMESFRRDNGRISVGDPRSERFRVARYRYLENEYYVPLEKFDSMGMVEFQTDRNIKRNYSQAAGLAAFFMHFDGGRYRDALIENLSQHYNVNRRLLPQVETLSEITGVDYPTLDKQYGEYVRSIRSAMLRARDRDETAPREP